MRTFTNVFLIACVLSFPASALAQNADPFGGAAGNRDPFAADPFDNGDAKPAAAKQPKNVIQAARRKPAAQGTARKAKAAVAHDFSEANQRIRSALDGVTSQTFIETPLVEAIQMLSADHGIPIFINQRALEEIGLSADIPVTVSLKNVSLRSFLRLMLQELKLTYLVKDEVMQITSKESAENNLVVQMHKFAPELTDKSDKIVRALTASVEPDVWDVHGGPCSVTPVEHVLVVSATEVIHEEVNAFMKKLQAAFEKHQAKP